MELPKYNYPAKTGQRGITLLKKVIEDDLNWLFRSTHNESDFGIDAYLDIISESNQVTGKTIAAQVKTGKSFFEEFNDFGWVFRGKMSHLNYYLNHDIPVIIILVSLETKKIYWHHCNPSKIVKAGNNWKITIPYSCELTASSKADLLEFVSPIKDYVSQLEHFWNINSKLIGADRMIFVVDKEEIEARRFKELKEGLERLLVNEDLVGHFKERVDIWVHGYDDDYRELFEIGDVLEWVNILYEEIDGWPYLLGKGEYDQFFRLIFYSLTGVKIKPESVKDLDGEKLFDLHIENKKLEDFIETMFLKLNDFISTHKIGPKIQSELTQSLVQFIKNQAK